MSTAWMVQSARRNSSIIRSMALAVSVSTVALLGAHPPEFAMEDVLAHLVPAVRARHSQQELGVEPLGEEDQVLAPLHHRHLPGEIGERAGEEVDLGLERGAVGPRDPLDHLRGG